MILLTGGTGYIGSHTCVALIEAGYEVIIIDNLSNSNSEVLNRIEQITNVRPRFVEADVRNAAQLDEIFRQNNFQAVIHFAGLKAVGESVAKPLEFYDNNVLGTLVLLKAMRSAGVATIVYSSSATIYGIPASVPISEDFPRNAVNPYGQSKLMVENILMDLHKAEPNWNCALLRYFNPVGAHASGLIGEDPKDIPNNLMPYIAQVAVEKREKLFVFGDDYPTKDGTGVRDYIHVIDLAAGHVATLHYLENEGGLVAMNLGTGIGHSVLEMVKAFEKASGCKVPYEIIGRRPGDIAECFADPKLAERLLGWSAQYTLKSMCADTWRWQTMNPDGLVSIK